MKKSLVFIGTLPPPVTGESLVNDLIKKNLSTEYSLHTIDANINAHATSPGKVTWKIATLQLNWIIRTLVALQKIGFSSAYIVCGQTLPGLLRFSLIILACKLKCRNVVIHFHGSQAASSFTLSPFIIRYFLKWVFSNTKIIVLSEKLVQSHSQSFQTHIHVVKNFAPKDDFSKNCARLDKLTKEETIRCLYMSNLLPEKGLWESISSVASARRSGKNICLEICGGGSNKIVKEIEQMEKEHDWIKYRGVLSGEQKYLALANSHVFLLPSYYRIEGMPISLLEAARFESVILTTNQGAICDFVTDGVTGYICRQRDVAELTSTLITLADNPQSQTSIIDNALNKVKTEYSFDQFSNAIKSLL